MSGELVAFLSRYIPVSGDLERIFRENDFVRTFPKGSVLLRPEDRAREAYFILKGCVRSYIVKDAEERTVDFFVEEDAVLPLGYGREEPAGHYLECLEDTVAVASDPDREREMLARYPELKAVCLAMSEIMAAKLQENLARYRTSTPEERYRDLAARRPDLLRRIPQYRIAEYLGIRPESLSRIRRRLARPRRPGGSSDRS
ncbi:MAG TPA: Crp/Fnr family transcriptional regulator [Spirochaetia bacterium]|nr:Crp/Fnr family transcriptional regulator [Spirochaetales bacterium]HRY80463.1 Crp/Fnr family transcriptional regulator [Spirochaetia bacterium]